MSDFLKEKLNFMPVEEIVGEISRSSRFREGFALTPGRRSYMEDFIRVKGCFGLRSDTDLYCVFDGHDGHEAAEYATTHFPDILWEQMVATGNEDDLEIDSIIDKLGVECCDGHSTREQKRVAIALHRSFGFISEQLKGKSGGTTALVVLLLGDDLFVANVGDTRSVLSNSKGKAVQVSTDHRPMASERERIEDMGGFISDMSVPRVNGILAISRALGDHDLASKGVICRPHIKYVPNFRDSHRYLIMASDGLWDYVKEGDALKIVNETLGYKVPAWRPRRGGGSSFAKAAPTTSSTSSSKPCSPSSSSSTSPAMPCSRSPPTSIPSPLSRQNMDSSLFPPSNSPSSSPWGMSEGQLAQSAPAPCHTSNNLYGNTKAVFSASVDSHEKEEGVFDLDFEEEMGESVEDQLVGSTCSDLNTSKVWEKLGMTPLATPSPPKDEADPEKEMLASKKLVELAFHQGASHDNISVIVVNFAEVQ